MTRLFLVLASFAVATAASGAVQGVHAMETIGELAWLAVGVGKLPIEAVAKNPDKLTWQVINNGDAMALLAKQDYFFRFKVPAASDDHYMLQAVALQSGSKEQPARISLFNISGHKARLIAPTDDRYGAFRLTPADYGQELILRATAANVPRFLKIELNVSAADEFEQRRLRDRVFIGVICGIIAIMILYNFATQMQFRKPYVTYHAFYSSSGLYWFLFRSGMIPHNQTTIPLFYVAVWGLEATMTLFSLHILNTKTAHARLHRLGMPLIALSTFLLTLTLFGFKLALNGLYLTAIATSCYCFALAVSAAYRGYRPAYAMLVGWLGMFATTLLHVAGYFVPGWPDLGWTVEIAAAVEIATFSFAMGQQMHQSELAFQEENRHAFAEMSKMIYPHQLERIRHGEHLESTMPTTSAQACVISLDLVGSSTIKHINAKEFFRSFFARCNAMMIDGYDVQELRSAAYRIKEMGDGFLCSIGYPFKSLSKNPANDAVDLARRFVQVLLEESAMLHSETPICCGIGIALDTLSGFYPEAGTKEYDLFGPALVLATRYEGMRKLLPQVEQGRSVIIVQAEVYASLDPAHRAGLQVVDLKEHGIAVRDHSGAEKLYYQLLGEAAEGGARLPMQLVQAS